MVRSVWKGPFVEGSLLKKADAARASGRHDRDQDLEPPLDHPAAVRRASCSASTTARSMCRYRSTREMVGHKFGEFSPTRTFHGHSGDRKPRRLED